MSRYRVILILTIAFLCVSLSAPAQDTGTETESAEPGVDTGIEFETGEDASLFVGLYRLNPGDTIRVEIVTRIVSARDTMIDDEGYIAIPVVGRVRVADLTLTEARDEIQKLADEYYVSAWVTIQLTQLGRVKFYVYGDLEDPGFYTASGATTFFDFLQRFNLTTDLSHRRIVHVRGERSAALPEPRNLITRMDENEIPSSDLIRESLRLYESGRADEIDERVTIADPVRFTFEGEIEQRNFYLEYGDVIYVPDPEVLVSIEGFRREGEYEVLPGENWSDLIRIAGNPVLRADISNLLLEKHDIDGDLVQLYYNLNLLNESKLDEIAVENRDRLVAIPYNGNVYVIGSVTAAGSFLYHPGLGPLDYLALAGGETPEAHLRFAAIIRPPRDPSEPLENGEIFNIDLGNTLLTGESQSPVAMQPGDILFIPDKGEEATLGTVLSGLSVLINAVRLFE
jgi:protein involved in polysaccharide export with SLBB domain